MSTNTIYFTDDHEYIQIDEDGIGTVGISSYAQQQLGDIVFVECPNEGASFNVGEEVAVVESVKVASEIYSPVSGEILESNEDLDENPALVNEDPMGDGWFFKISIADESELEGLKDETEYQEYLEEIA